MDKTILIQYCNMKEEIKDIRRRIAKLETEIAKLSSLTVTDSVKGSIGEKCIYSNIKITGKPSSVIYKKRLLLHSYKSKLELKEVELLEYTTATEEYIASIETSELRIMFRLYYIDGYTWKEVARKMNSMHKQRKIVFTEDNCRMRSNRFFDRLIDEE